MSDSAGAGSSDPFDAAGAAGSPGGPQGDLPAAGLRPPAGSTLSSGLSGPDFAACLDLGLEPVALVQGFCVMQWGWYGPGSGYGRGVSPYMAGQQTPGSYSETYRCPHGFVSNEHR